MNPRSTLAETKKFPPMAQVRKTLKIDWYRCPIDKEVLADLVKKSDALGFFQAAGHLGLWLLTGVLSYLFFNAQAWGWFLLLRF